MIVDIVLGCSFGDEGKGKVVYDLCKKNYYDICVRFNGSGNAGHTIYTNNTTKWVLHQLPVGSLLPNMYNLISSDCLVNIDNLRNEINELKNRGIDLSGRLFVSKACHIITQECIDYDRQNNLIGTTGSGIGPTYSQKMLRTGKRVEDFIDVLMQMGVEVVDMRHFWKKFQKKTQDTPFVLLEGAQGFELDINWTNNYPYCTSSTCTLAGAINSGIRLKDIRNIYGITKAYDTYVGKMEFQPYHDENLVKLGDVGCEYGSTTGRRRQCNYLNLDSLCDALRINNCNICIVNKADILIKVGIYRLYSNGNLCEFATYQQMEDFICDTIRETVDPDIDIIFSYSPYVIA
jgi:adenylosuccinate synthase